MAGVQLFCLGVIVGCLMGAVEMWRMNNRWHQQSTQINRKLADELSTTLAISLRNAARAISDPELSDALEAEAGKFERMWKA